MSGVSLCEIDQIQAVRSVKMARACSCQGDIQMQQQMTARDLHRLRNRYHLIRRKRIEMEQQFAVVDALEMLSTNTRDQWWDVLLAYHKEEQALKEQIIRLESTLGLEWSASIPVLIH